jgi:hypothetical protein
MPALAAVAVEAVLPAAAAEVSRAVAVRVSHAVAAPVSHAVAVRVSHAVALDSRGPMLPVLAEAIALVTAEVIVQDMGEVIAPATDMARRLS